MALELNEYEMDALSDALEEHIENLSDQLKMIGKSKHSSSDKKKEIKRNLTKKINLLNEIKKRLG